MDISSSSTIYLNLYRDPLFDSATEHFIPESEINAVIQAAKKEKEQELNTEDLTKPCEFSVQPKKYKSTFLGQQMILTREEWFKFINGYGESDDPGYDSDTDHFIPETEIMKSILMKKAEEKMQRVAEEEPALLDSSSEHMIPEWEIEEAIYNNSEHFIPESEIEESIEKTRLKEGKGRIDLAQPMEFKVYIPRKKGEYKVAQEAFNARHPFVSFREHTLRRMGGPTRGFRQLGKLVERYPGLETDFPVIVSKYRTVL